MCFGVAGAIPIKFLATISPSKAFIFTDRKSVV
jgi:hypothetical protein